MPNLGVDGGESEVNKADPFLYMQTWPYRGSQISSIFFVGFQYRGGNIVPMLPAQVTGDQNLPDLWP